MKILIVSPAYEPSAFGGIKTHVVGLAKSLSKLGHRVTVCTTNAYNFNSNMPLKGLFHHNDVQVYYFPNLFPKKYWFCPNAIPTLIRIVRQYDIVHMHNNYSFLNSIVFILCKIYKISYVFSAHGSYAVRGGSRLKKTFYNKIIGDHLIKGAMRIVLLTDQERRDYRKTRNFRKLKFVTIPNAVDMDDFISYRKGENKSTQKKILYLGRLHKIKGLDILVKAFAEVVKVEPNLKLQIVGPDFGFRPILQKLLTSLNLSKSVQLMKEVQGQNKISLLINSDLFVLPSRYDTFPMVILEACAAKLPIIITSNCIISNLLRINNAAVVTDCNHVSIADAIITLLKNPKLRLNISNNSYSMVCNSYSWDKIVIKFVKLYQDTVLERKEKIRSNNLFPRHTLISKG